MKIVPGRSDVPLKEIYSKIEKAINGYSVGKMQEAFRVLLIGSYISLWKTDTSEKIEDVLREYVELFCDNLKQDVEKIIKNRKSYVE